MKQEIKPKATLYGGTMYRSMAEAKTAESLDRLGLAFEYEQAAARGPRYVGGQYTPDFWVPGLNAYIEVAGVWNERHMLNTAEFARETGCDGWFTGGPGHPALGNIGKPVMMHVDGDGYMHPVLPMEDDEPSWRQAAEEFHSSYAMMGECGTCGRLFACTVCAAWVCPHCGRLNDGDDERFYKRAHGNLFDAAGVKRYGGR